MILFLPLECTAGVYVVPVSGYNVIVISSANTDPY
jgi:hypothetical protein